jgi:hypothetical protein
MPRTSKGGTKLSATLSVRVSARTRYGLLLLSRRGNEKMSEVVQAILTAAIAGSARHLAPFVLPDLEELWDPVPWVRLQKLKTKRPGLMAANEVVALETVMELGDKMNSDIWRSLQDRLRLEL